MNDKPINIDLTKKELTHIRVAMLHRLDKLKNNTVGDQVDIARSYNECLAMMQEGGVLCVAMRKSNEIC